MWKIVGTSKASVLYIYIYIEINTLFNFNLYAIVLKIISKST